MEGVKGVVVLGVVLALTGTGEARAVVRTPAGEYAHVWANLSKFYGAPGKPAPLVRFAPTGTVVAYTFCNQYGIREVALGPIARADLRTAAGARSIRARRRARVSNRRTLAHEWAHVYQADSTMARYPLNAALVEHQARLMARRVENAIRGKRGPGGDPNSYGQVIFGSNYGTNPRTIHWPGS